MSEQQKPRAISPSEAITEHIDDIPDEVFEVVNSLIAKQATTKRARVVVKQEDIVNSLRMRDVDVDEVFANGWLDIEDAYREQGWNVTYRAPSYGDSDVIPCFEFSVA